MPEICLPYGSKTIRANIPDTNYVETVVPRTIETNGDEDAIIRASLDNPIGSARLEEMARGRNRVAIVVDDYTRPTPVSQILPHVLDRLRRAGISEDRISIVFALGTHRPMTQEEIEAKIGVGPARSCRIVNKSVHTNPSYTHVCDTDMGVPVWILDDVIEADLRIGIGSIVPHCDVGYSGGAKILLPGVCSAETVSANHMKGLDFFGKNMLGEPTTLIRKDIEGAVGYTGLHFILNTVTTQHGRLHALVCGDFIEAHRAGVAFSRDVYGVPIRRRADISICASHPGDVDFIQVCKTYWSGDKMTRPGGDLIIVTPCTEGVGPYAELPSLMAEDRHDLERRIRGGKIHCGTAGVMASLAVRLNRISERIRVSMVTEGLPSDDADQMGLTIFPTVEEALADALSRQGERASISAMTHGGYTFPMVSSEQDAGTDSMPNATGPHGG